MKKITLFPILFLMIFINGSLFSQDNGNNRLFHFGLIVSPEISWFNPSDKSLTNDGAKLGFSYGLITEFGFTKNYAFSTGLGILNAGGKLSFQDSTFYNTGTGSITILNNRTYQLRYINIPLLLKLKTNPIGPMTYFGQFGFDASVLWKATADDVVSSNGSQTTINSINIYKDVNFAKLDLNIGFGAEYNLEGSTSLVVSLNYNNGFTNALRKDSKLTNNNLKQNAIFNYVSLTVGILF